MKKLLCVGGLLCALSAGATLWEGDTPTADIFGPDSSCGQSVVRCLEIKEINAGGILYVFKLNHCTGETWIITENGTWFKMEEEGAE